MCISVRKNFAPDKAYEAAKAKPKEEVHKIAEYLLESAHSDFLGVHTAYAHKNPVKSNKADRQLVQGYFKIKKPSLEKTLACSRKGGVILTLPGRLSEQTIAIAT